LPLAPKSLSYLRAQASWSVHLGRRVGLHDLQSPPPPNPALLQFQRRMCESGQSLAATSLAHPPCPWAMTTLFTFSASAAQSFLGGGHQLHNLSWLWSLGLSACPLTLWIAFCGCLSFSITQLRCSGLGLAPAIMTPHGQAYNVMRAGFLLLDPVFP
jgi:hypothetical protein